MVILVDTMVKRMYRERIDEIEYTDNTIVKHDNIQYTKINCY